MFCSFCGTPLQTSFVYCPRCAREVLGTACDVPPLAKRKRSENEESSTPPPSFREFAARKSEQRKSVFFRRNSRKSSGETVQEVMTNIGLMVVNPDGDK